MQQRFHHGLILTMIVLLTACSHGPQRSAQAGQSSLQDWVDTELSGYVAEQFSQHPRFKGVVPDVGGPTANMYGFTCCQDKTLRFGFPISKLDA